MTAADSRPDTAANSGAGGVVATLILLIGAAALQQPGPLLAAMVLFIAAIIYRVVSAPERDAGSERRHLAISLRSLFALLAGSFAFFVAVAFLATV